MTCDMKPKACHTSTTTIPTTTSTVPETSTSGPTTVASSTTVVSVTTNEGTTTIVTLGESPNGTVLDLGVPSVGASSTSSGVVEHRDLPATGSGYEVGMGTVAFVLCVVGVGAVMWSKMKQKEKP